MSLADDAGLVAHDADAFAVVKKARKKKAMAKNCRFISVYFLLLQNY